MKSSKLLGDGPGAAEAFKMRPQSTLEKRLGELFKIVRSPESRVTLRLALQRCEASWPGHLHLRYIWL